MADNISESGSKGPVFEETQEKIADRIEDIRRGLGSNPTDEQIESAMKDQQKLSEDSSQLSDLRRASEGRPPVDTQGSKAKQFSADEIRSEFKKD